MSCNNQIQNYHGVEDFDVYKSHLVFSYLKNGRSSLYLTNLINKKTIALFPSVGDDSYSLPIFSPNGENIAFVKNRFEDFESQLYISNSNGSDIEILTNIEGVITEMSFSDDGLNIYFTKAQNFKKFSPIATDGFHDVEIYSINIETKIIQSISKSKFYGLNSISEIDNNCLLLGIQAGYEGGMFLFLKDSINLQKLIPTNDPRKDASLYFEPSYSKKVNSIAFLAPYELYYMNLVDKKAFLILSRIGKSDFGKIRFLEKKIFFTVPNEDKLYSISTNGKDLTEIIFFSNYF
jgi:Tol biopolymer transport system component